jgi:hypothetical protein
MDITKLPGDTLSIIYANLSHQNRTNLRCCSKSLALMCPSIPPDAFPQGIVPPMFRCPYTLGRYDTITLELFTTFLETCPQLSIYRNDGGEGNNIIYRDIKKIAKIVGPHFEYIYGLQCFNKVICNWKYCDHFIMAISGGNLHYDHQLMSAVDKVKITKIEAIVALFLCYIYNHFYI